MPFIFFFLQNIDVNLARNDCVVFSSVYAGIVFFQINEETKVRNSQNLVLYFSFIFFYL